MQICCKFNAHYGWVITVKKESARRIFRGFRIEIKKRVPWIKEAKRQSRTNNAIAMKFNCTKNYVDFSSLHFDTKH